MDSTGLRLLRIALATISSAIALAAIASPAAAVGTSCDLVAAPYGDDDAAGSAESPLRTVQELVDSLNPGQVGCLRAGTYGGDALYMDEPDTALQSYPGERATLTAFLEVTPDAPRSRVSGLTIDTTGNENTVGTKLQADDAVLSDNVITKSGEGICVLAGTYNPAERVVIERNRIYDCGSATRSDGSHNKFDHLIYLAGTRNAIVRWNILTANGGGWGVHMYPGADGTLVEHNIIDGNQGGVIFAGDGDDSTSDDNTVRNNAITGSGPRWNVESSWSDGPHGVGNVATANCLYSPGPGPSSGIASGSGFSATDNTVLNDYPYVNRAAGDYRFQSGSPCATLVGDVVGTIEHTAEAQSSTASHPAVGLKIVVRTNRRRLAPQHPVRVRGKLITAAPLRAKRVALQVRSRSGKWRTLVRRKVRHGRFFSAPIAIWRVRRLRVARLRVVIPGRARSRVVRVGVSRRSHG